MNSRHSRTLNAVFTDPVPANIQWREIEALFLALGAEVAEGSGSRVRVALNGTRAVFHRPHPRPEVKRYAVRAVREFLTKVGVTP